MKNWLEQWDSWSGVVKRTAQFFEVEWIEKEQRLGGASGAETYLARMSTGKFVILKLWADPDRYQDEIKRYRRAYARFLMVNQTLHDEPIEHENLRCIPMELAWDDSGLLFSRYYETCEDPAQPAGIIKNLFMNTLRFPLEATDCEENVFNLYFLEPDLRKQLAAIDPEVGPSLFDWWVRMGKRWKAPSREGFVHGDLHADNFGVQQDQPRLIDLGLAGQKHLFRDLTKLEREIVLRLFSGDVGKLEEELSNEDRAFGEDQDLDKAILSIHSLRELAATVGETDHFDWWFEYRAALMAQYLFRAGDVRRNHADRRKALDLAKRLHERLEASIVDATLWRVAYSFLRLDQLPSGGWAKSLPHWFAAIFRQEASSILQGLDVRKRGGIALTGAAFRSYVEFLYQQLENEFNVKRVNGFSDLADRVRRFQVSRIDVGDAHDSSQDFGDRPIMNIHHTLVALHSFLLHSHATIAQERQGVARVASYLMKTINLWRREPSDRHFGIYCAILGILVEIPEAVSKLEGAFDLSLLPPDFERVKSEIEGYLLGMGGKIFFHSRQELQRADFLLHFPSLLVTHGPERGTIHPAVDPSLRDRFCHCLHELLGDIHVPFDPNQPENSLLRYLTPTVENIPGRLRDWGLSAELGAVLSTPAARDLLGEEWEPTRQAKLKALRQALRFTFSVNEAGRGGYHRFPYLFKFTHGVSFARCLALLDGLKVRIDELEVLEREIDKVNRGGVTERDLWELTGWILDQTYKATEEEKEIHENSWYTQARSSIKDLFVAKLEAGEHVPDDDLCPKEKWENRVKQALISTREFFDSEQGVENYRQSKSLAKAYVRTYSKRIFDLEGWLLSDKEVPLVEGYRSLDVGCGGGMWGIELAKMNFDVDLLDNSKKMLDLARREFETAGVQQRLKEVWQRDVRELGNFPPEQYDAIFSSAVLFHLPEGELENIFRSFFNILKPRGLLFVNLKIHDHSLISLDGRFFEYYRDHEGPMLMLEAAGFEMKEITLRLKRENMYELPFETKWANYYCVRPSKQLAEEADD